MKPKQSQLGQIIIDINLGSQKGRQTRSPGSFYEILKGEPGLLDEPDNIDNIEDPKSKQQDAVLRKTLRFCMKNQELGLSDIASSIDISKNKIINFLKNRNKNLLKNDDKRKLRTFLKKQVVSLPDAIRHRKTD